MSSNLQAQLQAKLNQESAADAAATDTPTGDPTTDVTALIARITGLDAEELSPERTLEDIALNSLAMIEFAVRAEEAFGVRISEADAAEFDTIADVIDFIAHS